MCCAHHTAQTLHCTLLPTTISSTIDQGPALKILQLNCNGLRNKLLSLDLWTERRHPNRSVTGNLTDITQHHQHSQPQDRDSRNLRRRILNHYASWLCVGPHTNLRTSDTQNLRIHKYHTSFPTPLVSAVPSPTSYNSSPDITSVHSNHITSITWNAVTAPGSDHHPIIIELQTQIMKEKSTNRTFVNFTRAHLKGFSYRLKELLES